MFYVQTTCLVAIFSLLVLSAAMIYKLDMPDGLQNYFDGAKLKHNVSDIPGEQIFWECMQRVMWQMAEQMGHNVTRETRDYLDRLLQIALDPNNRQLARHRKEYRMLSDQELTRFHNSIKALKQDTTLKPNVYSALSELHAGDVIPMAHFGAAFLGWHRVFLLIFETALRLKDPSVSVPYWASNLDHEMDDPTSSIIWSDKFLGNGDGFVTTGPFADFKVHSTDSILTRNIGASGSLMTNYGIHNVLSQNHTADITNPNAPHSHNLELQHNMVHVWVGGNMDDLSMSGEDPVFYLHHSFVDYLWEEFRTRQRIIGINSELDYPKKDWGSDTHAPEALVGFGDLRNVDALSNAFADLVTYDPSPVCSRTHPTCGSKYLRCELSSVPPVCVSLSREELSTGDNDTETETCLESHLTRAVQNSFAINQFCDIRRWVYIPVKIILQRPPEFTNYKAYPVVNNKPVKTSDVFSTVSINKTISKTLATYPDCKATTSVARNIFIESYGLNYYGKYKDFTVLDQRHALSTTTAYLGVKSPESNHTDVIVYAYDYCGRSCRPFCYDVTSDPPDYRPCSGVIRVTTEEPKMYGDNYAEAVNNVWHAESRDSLPKTADHFECVTFYCDFSGVWPWDEAIQNKTSNVKVKKDDKSTKKIKNNKQVKHQIPFAKKSMKNQNSKLPEVKIKHLTPKVLNTKNKTNKDQVKLNLGANVKILDLRNVKTRRTKTSSSTVTTKQRPAAVNARDQRSSVKSRTVTTRPLNVRHQNRNISQNREVNMNNGRRQPPFHSRIDMAQYFQGRQERPVLRRPLFRHAFFQTDQQLLSTNRFQFPTGSRECRLHPRCILPVPCSPCQHKEQLSCQVPARMMAICINGVFILEHASFNFIG